MVTGMARARQWLAGRRSRAVPCTMRAIFHQEELHGSHREHHQAAGEGPLSARDDLARARPLGEVLAELADMAAMARQGAAARVPLVTAHLAQGVAIHGELVDAASGPSGLQLCLARAVGHGTRDLAFVPASAVIALIVHDADRLLAPPAGAPEPPTRLSLMRAMGETRSRLEASTGAAIELHLDDSDEPAGRAVLGEIVPSALAALTAIAEDELGRVALAAKLAAVRIGVGDQAALALSDGTLTITAARRRHIRPDADALRAAIEKLI